MKKVYMHRVNGDKASKGSLGFYEYYEYIVKDGALYSTHTRSPILPDGYRARLWRLETPEGIEAYLAKHDITPLPLWNRRFEVGDGATVVLWSDRKAYTVVAVSKTGKTITLQQDKQHLVNGPTSGETDALTVTPGGFAAHVSGVQRWHCERDPEGPMTKATLRKNGEWVLKGTATSERGCRVFRGRAPHYDYNF